MRQVKVQYNVMEDELMAIGREFSMEPLNSLEQIWRLPKVREVEDLQARINCLLKPGSQGIDSRPRSKVEGSGGLDNNSL